MSNTGRASFSPWTRKYAHIWINSTFGWVGVISGIFSIGTTIALYYSGYTRFLSVALGILVGLVWTIWFAWVRSLTARYREPGAVTAPGPEDEKLAPLPNTVEEKGQDIA